jgi:hypothetical protein
LLWKPAGREPAGLSRNSPTASVERISLAQSAAFGAIRCSGLFLDGIARDFVDRRYHPTGSGLMDHVAGPRYPAGKCRHGGAPSWKRGIAKDPPIRPVRRGEKKAATDAARTFVFVNDLLIEAASALGVLPSLETKFAGNMRARSCRRQPRCRSLPDLR